MMATGPETLTLNAFDSCFRSFRCSTPNSWGLAFSCLIRGARLVMPGAKLDGASVYDLIETEKVTMTAAVPTVWLGLLHYLRKEGKRLSTLKFVGIGGSACPPEMIRAFQDDYGIEVRHAWGMTEIEPDRIRRVDQTGPASDPRGTTRHSVEAGMGAVRVEMKIVDDENNNLPWDGKRFGRVEECAGFAVVESYFRDEGSKIPGRQWFLRHGRRRDNRCRWVHADYRPREGRHQVRRQMDMSIDIENFTMGIRTWRSGGNRRASSEMGRTPLSSSSRRSTEQNVEEVLEYLEAQNHQVVDA